MYRVRAALSGQTETIDQLDEEMAVAHGLTYLLSVAEPGFLFGYTAEGEQVPAMLSDRPCLLANVGTGTSFIRVEGDRIQRVGGSILGGGTFLGMARVLLGADADYASSIELACKGNADNADMLIRDIFGSDYLSAGLNGTLMAATLAKGSASSSVSDVAAGWMRGLCVTLAQLAGLYADAHGCTQVVVSGGLMQDAAMPMKLVTQSLRFWTGDRIQPVFLKHGHFLGVLGALMRQAARP